MMEKKTEAMAMTEASRLTGLVSVEQQRAVAEVQAQMMIAKASPRNEELCVARILEDCENLKLAEVSLYEYARGGTEVVGPSIQLAEAMARRWGNMSCGIKELSRGNGYSDCVAYAWDLETGFRDERQFQVRHWRDTRSGGYALKDERDIYELIANMGQRRKRAVVLAVIPSYVRDQAVSQCDKVVAKYANTTPDGVAKMVEAFAAYSVSGEDIKGLIQRDLSAMTPRQYVRLKRIYQSLRDDVGSPGDWFKNWRGGGDDAKKSRQAAPSEKPPYTDEEFAQALPGWRALIAAGKATPDHVLNKVRTKHALTEAQQKAILSIQSDPKSAEPNSTEKNDGGAAPKNDDVPTISVEKVERSMREAKDADMLDATADLIGEIDDAAARQYLAELYTELASKFRG